MKSYSNALILFPLIVQGLAVVLTAILNANENVDWFPVFLVIFLFIGIPAFGVALIVAEFHYTRYNIAAIVLCSVLVGFFYPTIIMLAITSKLSFTFSLVVMCLITFCALFVLPWRLPKTKSS